MGTFYPLSYGYKMAMDDLSMASFCGVGGCYETLKWKITYQTHLHILFISIETSYSYFICIARLLHTLCFFMQINLFRRKLCKCRKVLNVAKIKTAFHLKSKNKTFSSQKDEKEIFMVALK